MTMDNDHDKILQDAQNDLLKRLESEGSVAVDHWRDVWSARYANDLILVGHFRAIAQISKSSRMPETKLVIVVHGIRDHGEWMEMVKDVLQSETITVQPIDFEFFDVIRFMTGFGVKSAIDRVLVKIRNAKADHPGSELLVIAHSFGTHIIAQIALDHTDLRFSRAIFCGSVICRSFPFNKVAHCPSIVNECGGRDIWPVIAEGFAVGKPYGAAGVWGLRTSGIQDRFHDTNHSGYLTDEFVNKYWKPYIVDNQFIPSPYQAKRRPTPWWLSMLSFGRWFVRVFFVLSLASIAIVFWLFNWKYGLLSIGLVTALWVTTIFVLYKSIKNYVEGPKEKANT